MEKQNNLRFIGEIETEFVEIISANGTVLDISKLIMSISVYEDIFSPFVSGNVVIKDSLDLSNIFPLVGEEAIRFSAITPTLLDKRYAIGGNFIIYKMADREELNDKSSYYILHFTSTEALLDMNKKISATVEGDYPSIARKLLTTNFGLGTKKQVNIEGTPLGTKFIANFWSPSKCLNYLASEAINDKGSPTYLFFENRYGFNFVSIESLTQNPVYQVFIGDNYASTQEKKDPNEMYKRIIDISIPVAFDYMEAVRNGAYSSNQTTYDLIRKRYSSVNFDSRVTFNNFNHLNSFSPNSNGMLAAPEAHKTLHTTSFNIFDNYGDVSSVDTAQQRKAVLTQMNMSTINITVHGRTDYTVGQKVEMRLNKKASADTDSVYGEDEDKVFSGYYLITSVHHSISREKHVCHIELMRESIPLESK